MGGVSVYNDQRMQNGEAEGAFPPFIPFKYPLTTIWLRLVLE